MIHIDRTCRAGAASRDGRPGLARRKKARRPVLEALEGRVVLSTLTWTGQGEMIDGSGNRVADPGWMNPGNWDTRAPMAGDDLVFPANPAGGQLTNTDNFPTLSLNSIAFAGAYSVTGASGSANSLTIAPEAGDAIATGISVLSNSTATIDLADLTCGVASTDGVTIDVAQGAKLVLLPQIAASGSSFSGAGSMLVTGAGEFDYPVTQARIDYSGTVFVRRGKIKVGTSKRVGSLNLVSGASLSLVQAGGGGGVVYSTGSGDYDGSVGDPSDGGSSQSTLVVDGTDPAGVVLESDSTDSIGGLEVSSLGNLRVDSGDFGSSATKVDGGGLLNGTGNVGTLTVSGGGTVQPGDAMEGTLNVTGDVTLGDGSTTTPANLSIGLSGTAAGNYGMVQATGVIGLNDVNLSVSPHFATPPPRATPFTILAGAGITGAFANVVPVGPKTGLYSSGGDSFLVSYVTDNTGTVTSVQLITLDSPTTTTLATSASTTPYARPLTLTATVNQVGPATGTPTGGVVFMDGATVIGSAALDASGVASFTTSTLAVKNHSLSAIYYGDSQDVGSTSTSLNQSIFRPVANYDGGRKTDLAVFLASTSRFAYRPSAGGPDVLFPFGPPGQSVAMTGDYDGDGTADLAVYIPSTSSIAFRPSDGSVNSLIDFGPVGKSVPLAGDFDGDGKTDLAVYMPGTSTFAYRPSHGGPDVVMPFGPAGISEAIAGDFDGDGKADFAVYIPSTSTFAYRPSSGGPDVVMPFGPANISIPVPGDYDGSGKTELAVYMPGTSTFAYRPARGGPDVIVPFGPAGGVAEPVTADYDGDGKIDLAVYLPSIGLFAYRPSSGGPDVTASFGPAMASIPLPTAATLQTSGPRSIRVPATLAGGTSPTTPSPLPGSSPGSMTSTDVPPSPSSVGAIRAVRNPRRPLQPVPTVRAFDLVGILGRTSRT